MVIALIHFSQLEILQAWRASQPLFLMSQRAPPAAALPRNLYHFQRCMRDRRGQSGGNRSNGCACRCDDHVCFLSRDSHMPWSVQVDALLSAAALRRYYSMRMRTKACRALG